MKSFIDMSPEKRTLALFQVILETVVSQVDISFYRRYKEAKEQSTDRAEVMRIGIAFEDEVSTLRKLGALVTPPAEIRKKAKEIATLPVEQIYGAATKYGTSLVAKKLTVITIKAYRTDQDRERGKDPIDSVNVITVEDFDRVVEEFSFPARYLSFESPAGKHLRTRDAARQCIASQTVKV